MEREREGKKEKDGEGVKGGYRENINKQTNKNKRLNLSFESFSTHQNCVHEDGIFKT